MPASRFRAATTAAPIPEVAAVVAAERNERPSVVSSGHEHIQLVSTHGAELTLPERSRLRMERQTVPSTVAIREISRQSIRTANERIVHRHARHRHAAAALFQCGCGGYDAALTDASSVKTRTSRSPTVRYNKPSGPKRMRPPNVPPPAVGPPPASQASATKISRTSMRALPSKRPRANASVTPRSPSFAYDR